MKTDDLISRLASDRQARRLPPGGALVAAVVVASLLAFVLLMTTIGPRPDFAQAAMTWRFDFKFVVTVTLAVSSFWLVRRAIYPEGLNRAPLWLVLAAPAVLLCGVAVELATLPGSTWAMTAIGKNARLCLTIVPALGIVPLGLILWGLKQGAPTRPMLSGFFAGLLAGGIAATFYAANCTDDSPLFVMTWYPISILALGLVGALLGRVALRW